jgi:hypothetical protein
MNPFAMICFVISVIAAFFFLYGFYNGNNTMAVGGALFFIGMGGAGIYINATSKSSFTDDKKNARYMK